jgi:hypothetical protein
MTSPFDNDLVDNQASTLFSMLKAELHFVNKDTCASTFAWYNGRERWVGLSVYRNYFNAKHLVIIFGEARNSDMLCVEDWLQITTMNPPTVENSDRTEATYQARKHFDPWGIKQAFKHIQELINNYERNNG